MAYHYVTYEDAQVLIPALEEIRGREDTTKDIKNLAGKFIQQLKLVREDVDYAAGGFQVYLTNKESEVFSEVIKWARGK